MKIKDVICEVYMWERPTPKVVTPEYPYPVGNAPLDILRIITDDETEGLFYRTDINLSESNVGDIKRLLIGQDPFDRELHWNRLWSLSRRKIRRDGYTKVFSHMRTRYIPAGGPEPSVLSSAMPSGKRPAMIWS